MSEIDIVLREDEVPLWLRWDNEPDDAWHAFVLYREKGVTRRLVDVVKEGDWTSKNIYSWKRKYNWEERIREYDRYEDSQRSAEIRKKLNDARMKYTENIIGMMEETTSMLQKKLKENKVQPNTLVNMMKLFAEFMNDEHQRINLEPHSEEEKLEKLKDEIVDVLNLKRGRIVEGEVKELPESGGTDSGE